MNNHLLGKQTPDIVAAAEEAEDTDAEYEVELIKEKRTKKGKAEYLVKWKGFDDPKEDTWEPVSNLQGPGDEAIKKFEKKISTAEKKTSRKQLGNGTEKGEDIYKKTLYQVTPSRRQLKGAASPSKSAIDVAKDKNKQAAVLAPARTAPARKKPTVSFEKVPQISVENRSNSRKSRAESRNVEEAPKVQSKRVAEQIETESRTSKSRRTETPTKSEPSKKKVETDAEKREQQRKEALLFGKPPTAAPTPHSKKPIKLRLNLEIELEEDQLLRLAQHIPDLLSLAKRV